MALVGEIRGAKVYINFNEMRVLKKLYKENRDNLTTEQLSTLETVQDKFKTAVESEKRRNKRRSLKEL